MFCLKDPDALTELVVVAAVLSGLPLVSFLYTAIVWFSYAFYREIKWTHWPSLKSLGIRWVFVVLMWLVAIGIVSVCGTCERTKPPKNSCLVGLTAAATVVLGAMSLWFLMETRKKDVVGVDRPPFYGPCALEGKLVVVTGANAGIGKETTRQLAAQGATVLMLCRNPLKAKQAMQEIRELQSLMHRENPKKHPSTISKDQLIFVPLDLTKFDSVKQAAKAIKQHVELRSKKGTLGFVDSLVCNAGLMMGTQSTTQDGLETMMQANHLGHFWLISLLMSEGLLKTQVENDGDEPSRVCLLTSSTYEFAASTTGFDFEDPYCSNGQRTYTLFGQYSMTKLANLLTAKELAKRYNNDNQSNQKLAVFAVHPGIVRTNVTSNMNWYWRLGNHAFGWIVASLSKTPEEGAYSTVHVVAAPLETMDYWSKGTYIVNCKEQELLEYVRGPNGDKDAQRLWEWSETELTKATQTTADSSEKKEQ